MTEVAPEAILVQKDEEDKLLMKENETKDEIGEKREREEDAGDDDVVVEKRNEDVGANKKKQKKQQKQLTMFGFGFGGGGERPRRKCRDQEIKRFEEVQYEEVQLNEAVRRTKRQRKSTKIGATGQGAAQEKKKKKSSSSSTSSTLPAGQTLMGVEFGVANAASGSWKELTDDLKEVSRAHLSKSLKGCEIATTWEFASVLDFYAKFGKEIYHKAKEVYRKHLSLEQELWDERDVFAFDDERIFSCAFFSAKQLADALSSRFDANGDSAGVSNSDYWLLADIHVILLKGIHPRSRNPPCRMNWVSMLKSKIQKSWAAIIPEPAPEAMLTVLPPPNPKSSSSRKYAHQMGYSESEFEEQEEGEEGMEDAPQVTEFELYNNMSAMEKLQCLRFLTELAFDSDSIRINKRIESALIHTSLSKKVKEQIESLPLSAAPLEVATAGGKKLFIPPGSLEVVDDLRMNEPFAKDFYGRDYWLVELYPEQGHCFLLREQEPTKVLSSLSSSSASKGKKKRRRSSPPSSQLEDQEPSVAPVFEVVCADGDEFLSFVEEFVDASLFGAKTRKMFREGDVLNSIIHHKEQMKKVQAAQQRLKSQLGSNPFAHYSLGGLDGMQGDGGGFRRSRRRRETVCYAENENMYDELINDAIRDQQTSEVKRSSTRRRKPIREWSEDEGGDNDGVINRTAAAAAPAAPESCPEVVEVVTPSAPEEVMPLVQEQARDEKTGGMEELEARHPEVILVPAPGSAAAAVVLDDDDDDDDVKSAESDSDSAAAAAEDDDDDKESVSNKVESDYEPDESKSESDSDSDSDFDDEEGVERVKVTRKRNLIEEEDSDGWRTY